MNNQIVSKINPISHYKWGDDCDGWNLVSQPEVSIKQEMMPANTVEQLHFHRQAEQFFYILKGSATFLVDGETITVEANQGLQVKAGQKHQIKNNTADELEFILFSHPSTINDRTNCE